MDQDTAQQVINKQAMRAAQRELDIVLLEVELEQAKAKIQQLEGGTNADQ